METFYNNGNNQIQMRPAFNLDMIFKTSENIIINPSVFYAMQGGASEIVFGSLFRRNLAQEKGVRRSELIVGAYHRIADALIGVAGYQYGSWQLTANYDFTISALAP